MSDYIPRDKDERFSWSSTFMSFFLDDPTALGFTSADASAITPLWTAYSDAYADLPAKENAYRSAVVTLEDTSATFIADVRSLVAQVQTNPAISDEVRAAAGLPIRSKTRTPASVPTHRPVAEVDASQRLQHLIEFRNQGATSKAKPEGVRGCEIWCAIGPAATLADARYLATDTATPYLATFPPEDAGKPAHYFLRWVNTRNQPGPWSETVTATIGG